MERMEITPVKPTINLDVLEKIDIRVGTIVAVEDVPQSEKLVNFTVETPVLATPERPAPHWCASRITASQNAQPIITQSDGEQPYQHSSKAQERNHDPRQF